MRIKLPNESIGVRTRSHHDKSGKKGMPGRIEKTRRLAERLGIPFKEGK